MGKISDFLAGIKVLEKVDSPENGEITVLKNIALGTYIKVGGLTQSGGIIKSIWNKTLRKVKTQKPGISNCLILGLGGGSIVEVIRKYWENAKITAIDIDPVIVDLGRKYLNLDRKEVDVVIDDAENFVNKTGNKKSEKYDLICVDLYVGSEFPEKFEKPEFLFGVKKIMKKGAKIVFNRLYYGEKRKKSVKFGRSLEKVFSGVEVVYPEANVMYVCSK